MTPVTLAICATTALLAYAPAGKILNTQTIQLPAGIWDCSASAYAGPKGAMVQSISLAVSSAKGSLDAFPNNLTSGPAGGAGWELTAELAPIKLAGPANYYVNIRVWFVNGSLAIKTAYNCTKDIAS